PVRVRCRAEIPFGTPKQASPMVPGASVSQPGGQFSWERSVGTPGQVHPPGVREPLLPIRAVGLAVYAGGIVGTRFGGMSPGPLSVPVRGSAGESLGIGNVVAPDGVPEYPI